jgi:hypothetical protein
MSLTTAIPYEGRLTLALQRVRLQHHQAVVAAELAREVEEPMPVARASLPGDQMRLRGIPAVGGRGSIGGAIRGTRPDVDAFGRDRGAVHALAVLVRDEIDGASPGTQPEEALLAGEGRDAVNARANLSLRTPETRTLSSGASQAPQRQRLHGGHRSSPPAFRTSSRSSRQVCFRSRSSA